MTAVAQNALAIEMTGVTRRFGKVAAVNDVTLHVPAGQTFGLVGPNGAGKSTALRMLMGMLRPQAGRVRLLGLDVFAQSTRVKQRVGYVPETPLIYRWMRVGEAIDFVRAFYPTWKNDECDRLLSLFGLGRGKKVHQLSKGMAVKLSLVLALAHDPDILIMDEPLSGLDPIVREEILDSVLGAVCNPRRTVLFSSHTLDDVQRLADAVGVMYEGRLLIQGKLDDLLASARRIRAVLRDGCLPRSEPAGIVWQRVERREWQLTVCGFSPSLLETLREQNEVDHVEASSLNLEDLFKDIVKGRRAPA